MSTEVSEESFTDKVLRYNPDAARNVLRFVLSPLYCTCYAVTYERAAAPLRGSLLIATHQRFDDIPLIGHVWNQITGRIPRFIMRGNLRSHYLKLGGIPAWRSAEIRKYKRAINKTSLDKGRDHDLFDRRVREEGELLAEYTTSRLQNGEDVCLFPSGSRRGEVYHTLGIEKIMVDYERMTTSALPVVPIAISYAPRTLRTALRTSAHINLGKYCACETRDDIVSALHALHRLAGYSEPPMIK